MEDQALEAWVDAAREKIQHPFPAGSIKIALTGPKSQAAEIPVLKILLHPTVSTESSGFVADCPPRDGHPEEVG